MHGSSILSMIFNNSLLNVLWITAVIPWHSRFKIIYRENASELLPIQFSQLNPFATLCGWKFFDFLSWDVYFTYWNIQKLFAKLTLPLLSILLHTTIQICSTVFYYINFVHCYQLYCAALIRSKYIWIIFFFNKYAELNLLTKVY